jgi:hypothetical protein
MHPNIHHRLFLTGLLVAAIITVIFGISGKLKYEPPAHVLQVQK